MPAHRKPTIARRFVRFAGTALGAVSLLLCAAAISAWAESYRQRYALSLDRVDDRPAEWVPSGWRVSLEPSCLYIQHHIQAAMEKSVVLPGPPGEDRLVFLDRPADGFHAYRESAASRWDWGFRPQTLRGQFVRFAWVSADLSEYGYSLRLAVIPLYAIVLVTALPPILWWRGRQRRRLAARRAAAGCCPKCGYDLRASRGRCPECGMQSDGAVTEKALVGDAPARIRESSAIAQWVFAVGLIGIVAVLMATALMPVWSWAVPGATAPRQRFIQIGSQPVP